MSNSYYGSIIKQNNIKINTLNSVYKDPTKRTPIQGKIKVLKPRILPLNNNTPITSNTSNYNTQENQLVNYNQNNNQIINLNNTQNNLYSEYPISNNNIINNINDITDNYFSQTTTELSSENNLENFFNGTYDNYSRTYLTNNIPYDINYNQISSYQIFHQKHTNCIYP